MGFFYYNISCLFKNIVYWLVSLYFFSYCKNQSYIRHTQVVAKGESCTPLVSWVERKINFRNALTIQDFRLLSTC